MKSILRIVFILLFNICVSVDSRNRNQTERTSRAMFIRTLMKKQMNLEGKIKLMGGPSKYEGNVYIYHAGRWGAVCDDSWNDLAARVVCRMFNRTGIAAIGGNYGRAIKKFWLDDIVCEGHEKSLMECLFSGWGASECFTKEAAGVICVERTEDKPVYVNKTRSTNKKLPKRVMQQADLRLMGSKNGSQEGRVEIRLHGNRWGSICPIGWSLYEASVVCRHLKLGYAKLATQSNVYGHSIVLVNAVACYGNETSLFQCDHEAKEEVECPADIGYVAGVVCTNTLPDLELDIANIERSAHLQDVTMFQLQCALEENCLSKSAYDIQANNPDWHFETRRLLRFTASSLNIGNAVFSPYLPKNMWEWHLCHMHYHSMEVFATFDILKSNGKKVAQGHKASFCLEDNTCQPGVEKVYSCKNYGDQGISVNCSDIYHFSVDCQWVDVTDVLPGLYTFKVAINPQLKVAEQNYLNNAAICQLRLASTYAVVHQCRLDRP